jgi:hypothetical protein
MSPVPRPGLLTWSIGTDGQHGMTIEVALGNVFRGEDQARCFQRITALTIPGDL